MNSYYVYILTSKTRTTVYIGVTNDLATRLDQHQNAAIKSFTKKYRLTRLVYYESFGDVNDAIAREKQLKGWRREKKNALIATANPRWEDVSGQLF